MKLSDVLSFFKKPKRKFLLNPPTHAKRAEYEASFKKAAEAYKKRKRK